MAGAAQQGLALAGAAFGLTLVGMALWGARGAWLRHPHPVDRALSIAALVWLAQLLLTTLFAFTKTDLPGAYLVGVGDQLLIISVAYFLLTCAGASNGVTYALLGAQAVAGGVALHWYHWGDNSLPEAYVAWIAINLVFTIFLTAAVAYRVYLTRSFPCWLALAGCLFGLGLGVDDLLQAEHGRHIATVVHHFYAGFLLVIWHLIKQRVEDPGHRLSMMPDFQRSSLFESQSSFGEAHDMANVAVANERRRIALDLHDGVGSQLVNILSTLDGHAPGQQAVMLALEQCLSDLKMTVDAIDGANDNVLEALGRLRYRMQHSLDKLGIRMLWKVEICGELEAVHGEQSQQVLRIAQECLTNVMRHAGASVVGVALRFVPETRSLVMEVRDNGKGIGGPAPGGNGVNGNGGARTGSGKGLQGMRRRAQLIGAELVIASKPSGGTRVRLTLPLTDFAAQPAPSPASNFIQAQGPGVVSS